MSIHKCLSPPPLWRIDVWIGNTNKWSLKSIADCLNKSMNFPIAHSHHLIRYAWLLLAFILITMCSGADNLPMATVNKQLMCDFPDPYSFSGRRSCSAYLGVPYICDPEAMISRTEAEAVDSVLNGKFQSCIDCLTHSDCHVENVTVGIAFLRNSQACMSLSDLEEICGSKGGYTDDQIDQFLSPTDMGKLLADRIRIVWSTDQCETDVLLLVIGNWISSDNHLIDGYHSSHHQHIFVAFSSRLSHLANHLPKLREGRKLPSLIRLITWLHRQLQINPLQSLLPSAALESDSILDRTAKSFGCVPIWAMVIFSFCSLTGLLCAALGIRLNKTPRQRGGQTGNALSIRYANRRWRAGFAGGVLSAKVVSHTGKEETTTKRLAPMMFRQFTQVKTTKVSPNTSDLS